MTTQVELVQRVIDDVMNGRDLDLLDELCTPIIAPKLRTAFSTFRDAFPDWYQEALEFVTDGRTVVAGCVVPAPTRENHLPTTKIDEVYFFRIADNRNGGLGASKTPRPACDNSPATTVSDHEAPWQGHQPVRILTGVDARAVIELERLEDR